MSRHSITIEGIPGQRPTRVDVVRTDSAVHLQKFIDHLTGESWQISSHMTVHSADGVRRLGEALLDAAAAMETPQ